MPLLLEHLRDSNQALRVQNGLYEAALADLDRRTRALQERVDAVLRESKALKDERDQLVAAHEAKRVMLARAGLKRIAVTTDSMQLEILATNAPADRLLLFCAREFPTASILLDDEPQDVDSLAKKAAAEFMREGLDVAIRVASELGGLLSARAGAAGYSSQSQEHASVAGERQVDADQVPEGDPSPFMPIAQLEAAPPAPSGPSLAVWREAADSEVQGLAALITHVHAEQTRPRAPLGQYTPPYHPPRLRHAARTGRRRISQWLEDLHFRGLELASGLRTAQDIARHLNPGNDVVQRAGLSPQTLVKFKAQPGDRSVETLVRIAVAMGRVDLLELRSFAVKQLPEGLGSTDSVARTIN